MLHIKEVTKTLFEISKFLFIEYDDVSKMYLVYFSDGRFIVAKTKKLANHYSKHPNEVSFLFVLQDLNWEHKKKVWERSEKIKSFLNQ